MGFFNYTTGVYNITTEIAKFSQNGIPCHSAMVAGKDERIDARSPGLAQDSSTARERRPRRQDVVEQQDVLPPDVCA